MSTDAEHPPEVLLLVAPGCPHCATVLASLSTLIKDGSIARLEVVNVAVSPEPAASLGVRSVPWLRIGPFVLAGAHSVAELRDWVARAAEPDALTGYIEQQLADGHLDQVATMLRFEPQALAATLPLLADSDTGIQVRLGLDALLEDMAGSAALQDLLPELGELLAHSDARIRADACHYVALTRMGQAERYLESCLTDESADVRESAEEALAELRASG